MLYGCGLGEKKRPTIEIEREHSVCVVTWFTWCIWAAVEKRYGCRTTAKERCTLHDATLLCARQQLFFDSIHKFFFHCFNTFESSCTSIGEARALENLSQFHLITSSPPFSVYPSAFIHSNRIFTSRDSAHAHCKYNLFLQFIDKLISVMLFGEAIERL